MLSLRLFSSRFFRTCCLPLHDFLLPLLSSQILCCFVVLLLLCGVLQCIVVGVKTHYEMHCIQRSAHVTIKRGMVHLSMNSVVGEDALALFHFIYTHSWMDGKMLCFARVRWTWNHVGPFHGTKVLDLNLHHIITQGDSFMLCSLMRSMS